MTLVTPDEIVEVCFDVIRVRHVEAIAQLERIKGLTARTLPMMDVNWLAGEALTIKTDSPPIALLGVFGVFSEPQRRKYGDVMFDWNLAMEVHVAGMSRDDVIRRAYWYGMTAAQTLLTYVPRLGNPVTSLPLRDVEPIIADEDSQQAIGIARYLFGVTVNDGMSTLPFFRDPPPDPYAVPGPHPDVLDPRAIIEKVPLPEPVEP